MTSRKPPRATPAPRASTGAAPASKDGDSDARRGGIGRVELVALLAMLIATVAFSIDAMLPALPRIGLELVPEDPNSAQLILSAFIVGMGVGTFFTGPLSDSFGRKPVILVGSALYAVGAILAWVAPSLELMVAARLLQGVGASGPRIVVLAIVRDLYSGREMARLISFVMIVFTIFPAIAPAIGQGIIAVSGWRAIFAAFVIFAAISSLWLILRLPEPLPRERRRPYRLAPMLAAIGEMARNPMVRLSIAVQAMIFATLFTSISLIQPVFSDVFDRGESFPIFFFGIGIFCATSSLVNSRIVMTLGMRAIVTGALAGALALTCVMIALHQTGIAGRHEFWFYLVWQTAIFYQMGLTMGNLNALAMEPLGHIAGMAASVIGALSTVFAGVAAALVAQTFDGTAMPLYLASAGLLAIALPIVLRMRRLERIKS